MPMKKSPKIVLIILVLTVVGGGVYYALTRTPAKIILTGIVTTDEIIVSPEIQGRLQQLFVKEGDSVIVSGGYGVPDKTEIKIEATAPAEPAAGDKGADDKPSADKPAIDKAKE